MKDSKTKSFGSTGRTDEIKAADEQQQKEIRGRNKAAISEPHDSEERFRSLFENMLDGFAHCKMLFEDDTPHDFVYINVNNAFQNLTGLKDVIGKKVTEVIPGIRESNPELLEIYGRVALTGVPESFETYVDSLGIWFYVSAYSPEKEYFIAIFNDITMRKRAEAESRRNKSIIETTNDGFWVTDLDGYLLEVNQAYADIIGYTKEELTGMHISRISVGAPTPEAVSKRIEQVVNRKVRNFETQHRHKDGHVIDIEATNTYLPEEKVVFSFLRDITGRKRADAVLKQHQAIIEATSDGFWMMDLNGQLLEVNQAYANMMGYSKEEMVGMSVTKISVATATPELVKKRIEDIISHGIKHFETRHRHKDGHILDIEATNNYLPEEKIICTFLRDITERKKVQQELERNHSLLQEAQRLGKLGTWELDVPSGELQWSDEVFRIFELDPSQFSPSYENFLNVIHPDDRNKVNLAYTKSLEDKQPYDIAHRLLFPDGRVKWVHEHCNSEFDTDGKPLRSLGAVQDITEQHLSEDSLRVAAAAFETHEGIMITDADANIIRVNQAFQDITGYSAEEVLGKNPRILSSGRQDKAFYTEMWRRLLTIGSWSGEIWDKRKNGQIYPKWLTITAVKDESGKTTEYVAMFSDITNRKRAEEEIRNLAFYDALTKLPNRRLLMDRFRLALSISSRSNHYGALLFLDIDRFKTLNDTLGHDYGDMMLIETAQRIQSCVREVDTVARLGGDEFVVLIEDVSEDAEDASQKAALIAEKICVALTAPYELKGHEYHSSASVGVCLYRGNEESVDDLLKHADLAMYEAKDSGRNAVRFFDPFMQQAVETRAALEADLRSAVANRQLRLYYQIQVDNEHRPLGAEALVRWIHPVRGVVLPAQFISIAEESSLILDVGNWVLQAACQQLAVWSKNEQTRDLILAVNVSAQQFRLYDFVDSVAAMARVHQVDPTRLKLELTESVVLSNVSDVVAKMHALKGLGVRLSLDDFGTGYSSLSYLKQLPLDQLKIDQSFVRDVTSDPNDAVLVQTIIDMAQNFRLNVIAEGVENEAQLGFLRQNGCMAYQGHLFGKPMPIEEFEVSLAEL